MSSKTNDKGQKESLTEAAWHHACASLDIAAGDLVEDVFPVNFSLSMSSRVFQAYTVPDLLSDESQSSTYDDDSIELLIYQDLRRKNAVSKWSMVAICLIGALIVAGFCMKPAKATKGLRSDEKNNLQALLQSQERLLLLLAQSSDLPTQSQAAGTRRPIKKGG